MATVQFKSLQGTLIHEQKGAKHLSPAFEIDHVAPLLPVTCNHSLEKVHGSQHGLEGFPHMTSALPHSPFLSLSLCYVPLSVSQKPRSLSSLRALQ